MCRFISSSEYMEKMSEYCSPNNSRGKNKITIQEDFGQINFNYFSTGLGFTYSCFQAQFIDDTVMDGLNHEDFSFLCFNTGHSMCMKESKTRKELNFQANMCYNGEQFQGRNSEGLYCKNIPYFSHYITFDRTLFNEIINKNENYKNLQTIYQNDFMQLNFNNILNLHQKTILNDLCSLAHIDDKLQELYFESKLLELIYTTINSIETEKKDEEVYLSTQDITSLHKAKTILLENMANPPSIKELAYKSAINEFKLKKGFKHLFGNTVYGLLQEHRLNQAKELLESNDINISEASNLVGYKSISHFSKIFKEHYGIAPIQIKKNSRIYY